MRALTIPGVISGALLITLLMIGSRIVAAGALRLIYGAKEALLTGLALSMPLTLLVAVATIGFNTNLLDMIGYYQLILASIFEILIGMVSIKLLHHHKKEREER